MTTKPTKMTAEEAMKEYTVAVIADCTPVPTKYLEQLERALWAMMEALNYPEHPSGPGSIKLFAYLMDTGMIEKVTGMSPAGRKTRWTDKAHEFAKRMKEKS